MDYDIREQLTPKRVMNAMWDYSWLKMHHEGGAFEDFGKVLDELQERGFNTVRIDCFPLVIGKLNDDNSRVTFGADPTAAWGFTDAEHQHTPIRELLDFMEAAKARGIYVILSSWGSTVQAYPNLRQEYTNRDLFREAWNRVLDHLGEADLLEHVLYVDLDQEFPYWSPFQDELKLVGSQDPSRSNVRPPYSWTDGQRDYVRRLFDEMLKHFQNQHPALRFTFSLTSHFADVRDMRYDALDVLEVHLYDIGKRILNRTGFYEMERIRGQYDYTAYQTRIDKTLAAIRPMMLGEMRNRLSFVRDWGREIAAPVVTTEAWGPWWHMDNATLRWDWLADWCAECVVLAAEYRLWGITPWQFAHPYWENWSDVEWYQKVNASFLQS